MSKDQKEICLYCRWWNYTGRPSDDQLYMFGQCRRFLPSFWGGYGTSWPDTRGMDFCGEFTERRDDHE